MTVNDPVHQVEADETDGEDDSRVFVDGARREAANLDHVVRLVDLKLSGGPMRVLVYRGCSRNSSAGRQQGRPAIASGRSAHDTRTWVEGRRVVLVVEDILLCVFEVRDFAC